MSYCIKHLVEKPGQKGKGKPDLASQLKELLEKNRKAILGKWFDRVAESYPPETARFLKSQKDQFHNPVGSTVRKETAAIFDQLLTGSVSGQQMSTFVDRIVRVRAVQDFTPSQAVGFIFQLKQVIREVAGREAHKQGLHEELLQMEDLIDQLGLMAFDIYGACRDKLNQIRMDEFRRQFHQIVRRSDMFVELSAPVQEEPDLHKVE